MAEKLVSRIQKVQGELKEVADVLKHAQNISEDDLFDGDYFVDQLNKNVRKLKTLRKNYESCSQGQTSHQQTVVSLSPQPSGNSNVDVGSGPKEDLHNEPEEKCSGLFTASPPTVDEQKVTSRVTCLPQICFYLM